MIRPAYFCKKKTFLANSLFIIKRTDLMVEESKLSQTTLDEQAGVRAIKGFADRLRECQDALARAQARNVELERMLA